MDLFEGFPTLENDREKTLKTIKNAKSSIKSSIVLKKGKGLLQTISDIIALVHSKLGKYSNKYLLLTEVEAINKYFQEVKRIGICAIDTETSSLDPITTSLAGVCLYAPGLQACYIPLNHVNYITNQPLDNNADIEIVRKNIQECIDSQVKWVFHNAIFDIRVLRNQLGVTLDPYWDTQVAAHCLDENESHRLKDLHLKYCQSEDNESLTFNSLFKGVTSNIVPIDTFYLYAAGDAIKTYELMQFQQKYLNEKELPGVYNVFSQVEMPILSVVVSMEDNGICIDLDYINQLSVKYNTLLKEKEEQVNETLREYEGVIEKYKLEHPTKKLSNPINIASSSQISILLYDILNLECPDKKKKRSTDEKVLSTFNLPFAKALLAYREIAKLVSTYIDKMPDCINPKTHKVHCRFNPNGAATGRFSSESPNLQNIPSHNTDLRKMFVASPGCVLISSDYSKQEPLILAQFCQDKSFIKAFTSGRDVYAEIASACFSKPYDQCLEFNSDGTVNKAGKERRSQAKTILLGTMYGRGASSVAQQINSTKEKAQEIITTFYNGFPKLKKWMDQTIEDAKTYGYVETLYGRKRRLPDMQLAPYEFNLNDNSVIDLLDFSGNEHSNIDPKLISKYFNKLKKAFGKKRSEIITEASKEGLQIIDNTLKIADATRQCVNARIQGSAANITKRAMIKIYNDKRMQEIGCKILIPVHDELICECPKEYAKECSELLPKLMIEAASEKIDIPINCDVEITEKWYGEEIKV